MIECKTAVRLRTPIRITDLQRLLLSYLFARQHKGYCAVSYAGPADIAREAVRYFDLNEAHIHYIDITPANMVKHAQVLSNHLAPPRVSTHASPRFMELSDGTWGLLTTKGAEPELIQAARARTRSSSLRVLDQTRRPSELVCWFLGMKDLHPEVVFADLFDLREPFWICQLFACLATAPPHFRMFEALRSSMGDPLRNSDEDIPLGELKGKGFLPLGVACYLLYKAGMTGSLPSPQEVTTVDSLERFLTREPTLRQRGSRVFELPDLFRISWSYLPEGEQVARLTQVIEQGIAEYDERRPNPKELKEAVATLKQHAKTIRHLTHLASLYCGISQPLGELEPEMRSRLLTDSYRRVLKTFLQRWQSDPRASFNSIADDFVRPGKRTVRGGTPRAVYRMLHEIVFGSEGLPNLGWWIDRRGSAQLLLLAEQRWNQINEVLSGGVPVVDINRLQERAEKRLIGELAGDWEGTDRILLIGGKRGYGKNTVIDRVVEQRREAEIYVSVDCTGRAEVVEELPGQWIDAMTSAVAAAVLPERLATPTVLHAADKTWSAVRSRLNAHLRQVRERKIVVALKSFDVLDEDIARLLLERIAEVLTFIEQEHRGRVGILLPVTSRWREEIKGLSLLDALGYLRWFLVGALDDQVVWGVFGPKLAGAIDANLLVGHNTLIELASWVGGNPTLARMLFDLLGEQPESFALIGATEPLRKELEQASAGYFDTLWDSLADAERLLLVGMAQRKIERRNATVGEAWNWLYDDDDRADLCGHLCRLGILRIQDSGSGSAYHIFSELFASWIVSKVPDPRQYIADHLGIAIATTPMGHLRHFVDELGTGYATGNPGLRELADAVGRLRTKTSKNDRRAAIEAILKAVFIKRLDFAHLGLNEEGLYVLSVADRYLEHSFSRVGLWVVDRLADDDKEPRLLVEQITALRRNYGSIPLLVVFLGLYSDWLTYRLKNLQPDLDLCVLSEGDLKCIMATRNPDPRRQLRAALLRDLGGRRVNPYQVGDTLINLNMFVGRELELGACRQRAPLCFFVIGGRQIGKSSFMKKLLQDATGQMDGVYDRNSSRRFNLRGLIGDHGSERPCGLIMSLEKSLTVKDILRNFGDCVKVARWPVPVPDDFDSLDAFSRWLTLSANATGATLHLMVDECEGVLNGDKPMMRELFKRLRDALQRSHNLALGISGRQVLSREAQDVDSPCFNMATISTIWLGPLRDTDVFRLVSEPLEAFGCEVTPVTRTRILSECFMHPAIIQTFCRLILERKIGAGEVTPEELESVARSDDFTDARRKLLFIFLSSEEKAVLRLFVGNDDNVSAEVLVGRMRNPSFTPRRVECLLQDGRPHAATIARALERLHVSSVLCKDRGQYKMVAPKIWEYYVELLKLEDKEERAGGPQ